MSDVLRLEMSAWLITNLPCTKMFHNPIRDPSLNRQLLGWNGSPNRFSCFQSPCEHNPCKNGGTCVVVNHWTDFRCDCLPSTHGRTCSEGRYLVLYTKFFYNFFFPVVHAVLYIRVFFFVCLFLFRFFFFFEISNDNRTEWRTVQGVIGRVISNQPSA